MEAGTLEYRILSLLRNRDAYLKYATLLKEPLFESKHTRYIYKLIAYYHKQKRGKKLAPLSSLYALVNVRVKENEAQKYKEIIRKIKQYPFDDDAIADEIVRRFAKGQILKLTILDAVNSLNNNEEEINVERLRARLDEAILVESTDLLDTAYDYFASPFKRLQQEKDEPRIASKLSYDIDHAIHGGLAAGDLGVIVAPTSVGKTLILINLAYNAMLQSKKVLYVTLELSARKIAGRFDQLVTRKPYEYIVNHPGIVQKHTRKLKEMGAGLRIKDSTANKMSPNDLGIYLERIKKEFEFDMVIVDQIDLMYSPKEYKEKRHELSSIIIALRRLGASFNIPIWTASQATRIAGAAGKTSLWDISEDIGKANWADVILTLSQSPEDKEEGLIFVDMAKNRIGEGNPRCILDVDYKLMRVSTAQEIKLTKPDARKKKGKKNG